MLIYSVYAGWDQSRLTCSKPAGVDTVPELKQRSAKALYETLVKINGTKKLVRKLPTADPQWVEQAKSLPRLIQY